MTMTSYLNEPTTETRDADLPVAVREQVMTILATVRTVAASGNVTSGRALLHAAWLQARADRESGATWAEALIDCYDELMNRYAIEHQLRGSPAPTNSRVPEVILAWPTATL